MNPKDPARTVYDDGVDESGTPTGEDNKQNSKYYREKIIHNDGSVTITVYERHTDRVVSTKEGSPDPDQSKVWKDEQDKVSAPGGKTTAVLQTPSGPRVFEYDPATGNYTKDLGPAPATGATATPARTADLEAQAAQDQREKEANQAAGGQYETNAAKAARERQAKIDEEARAARAAAEARAQSAEGRAANAGGQMVEQPDGSIHILKPDGTSIKTDLKAKPKPSSHQTVKGDDGATYVISVDADNNVTTTVAIPSQADVDEPPGAPEIDLTPGQMMESVKAYKNWLSAQSGLTTAQKKALLDARTQLVVAAAREAAGVAGISSGIMGEMGAEARSQRQQVNTRLNEAGATFRSATDYIKGTAQFQGRNGPDASGVLDYILARSKAHAQEMGGMVDTPTNPIPTQLTPYYTVPGQGAPAGAAPAPPVQPQPDAPFVPPPTGAPGGTVMPAPGVQQPLYAPPGGMQQAMMPQVTAQPAPAAPPMGGQFAELDAIMRRAGLDPNAVDLANNLALVNMMGGTW